MKEPDHGWSTPAVVSGIIDGDTLEVEVRRYVTVRLADCWCPEVRTRDRVEKKRGLEAKAHMESLAPVGTKVTLFVPTDGEEDVKDIFTFGRVVGRVFADGRDVSVAMVNAGHGTKEKNS